MSAQDRTEEVLREIHVLFSKAEPFNGSKKRVVIDKSKMMDLLKELNDCMYDMLEEHELTVQSRDKANRQLQKQGDDMVFEARKNAEDVYAASLMYSDRALEEIQTIMKDAEARMNEVHEELLSRIAAEKRVVKDNQYELKSQLQDMIDTQKYLRLIEDENIRRKKEMESGQDAPANPNPYADIKPEIHINEDYFRAQGISLDGEEEPAETNLSEEEIASMQAELDAEYFDWKEEEKEESNSGESRKVFSLFGKKDR
ncbi:MAG: hypothetical protein K6A05_02795 [Lachnospiraceae bacterium]|nr:hypothetical protein [Lachnospiraceae bacterium]